MGGCVLALYLVLWLAMCLFESGLFEGDASGCEAYLSPALQNKETNRQKTPTTRACTTICLF